MRNFTVNSLLIHDITQDIYTVGYYLHTPISGIDFPSIRLSSYNKPGEHGAIVPNQLYGGRSINLTGEIVGPSISTYYTNRRALQAAVRIVKNNFISLPLLCTFQTDDGLNLQTNTFASKMQMDEMYIQHGSFLVTLFAPDPNLYSQTLQTDTLPIGSHTSINGGDANTYPVITFVGSLTSPIITNAATGETFKLDVTITGGHSVVVDMLNKTIVLDGVTNYNLYFDSSNTWLSFVPGNNALSLATSSGGDTGHCSVSFRNSFVGT